MNIKNSILAHLPPKVAVAVYTQKQILQGRSSAEMKNKIYQVSSDQFSHCPLLMHKDASSAARRRLNNSKIEMKLSCH